MLLTYGIGMSSVSSHSNSAFLSRVSILRRDIDTANMSVRYVPVSDENSLTYRHSFSPYGSPIILVLPASNIFTKFQRGHPCNTRALNTVSTNKSLAISRKR